jgi:protein-S-isoprenylcysteine O-methyltransferase Ste14
MTSERRPHMRLSLGPALGTTLFAAVPLTVAGLIPWWISGWRWQSPLLGFEPGRWLGLPLLALAGAVLVEAFVRFARHGGTPAPVAPTRRLVISGSYRYVRNPMYCAVLAAVLGQALLLGDERLLAYATALWLMFHLFVTGYEEPKLLATHGAGYEAYWSAVPRWLPRLGAFGGR